MNENSRPIFRNSFMGYNKAEVDNYVARLESELEISESRQGKWEKQIQELQAEVTRLNNRIDAHRTEEETSQQKKEQLEQTISDLEKTVQNADQEKAALRKKLEDLQNSMEQSDANPKIIQDAILNAQRMSEMVISEAGEEAEKIKKEAQMYQFQQENEAKQIIEDARIKADEIARAGQEKYEKLQSDYNRALMDVTQFKAEIMNMYRKHMELLVALPEAKIPRIEYVDMPVDADKKEDENHA